MTSAPIHLSTQNVSLSFGGTQALNDVSFDVCAGDEAQAFEVAQQIWVR